MADRRSLPARVKRAFRLDLGRGRALESELDDEIRFHLEQRVAELMASGWTRDAAETEALARFGPFQESKAQLLETARARDEVLTMFDRLENFRHDVRFATRQLARSPGLTAAVVLTFALGIGANATMFGVIDRLLLRPPAYVRHPETVVTLAAGVTGRSFSQRTFNYPVFRAIRDHARGLTDATATFGVSVPIGRGESAQSARGLLVTANYFTMLGVNAAIGRFFRADEDAEPTGAPVVVLRYDYWMSHFAGDLRAVGKVLEIADGKFTIVGVAPRGFSGLDIRGPDLWVPMSSAGLMMPSGRDWSTNASGSWLNIFARRRIDVPAERAAADAMRVAREAAPAAWFTGSNWSFAAIPIMATRGSNQGVSSAVTRLLGAMSLIVLLIACANVANLLLARGLRRRQEIAVRLALGISRGRLVVHLLTESMVLALLGGLAAFLVAYWGSGVVFKTLFSDIDVRGSLVDMRVLGFTAIVTVATGALTGLLPALRVSRPELAAALKSGSREAGGRRSRTRRTLLVVQTAMSLVLLFGAGLFVRSLAKLNAVRLGVDVDRVLVGSMNLRAVGRTRAEGDQIFAQALERVSALPGVTQAALAATVPFGASYGYNVTIQGPDSLIHADALYNVVTPQYFRALGARLLRGRDFQPSDAKGAQRVMIVNEMLATRYWGKKDPIGECVRAGSDTLPCAEIVGVVENVRRQSIFEDSTGFVYHPLAQAMAGEAARQLVIRVDRGTPAGMIEPVRLAMQTSAAQLPYADVHLLADDPTVRIGLRPFRLGAAMFGVFGVLALALAGVGIYGVVSYNVGQRTREMGVRIALGARRASVAGLVVKEGLFVATTGALIGAAIALLGARFIAPLLYEQSARDPVVLLAVGTVLVATGSVACLIPAWRAVNIDPIEALRSD